MRTILITNDDGIWADGLVRLAEAASQLAKVYVIAPEGQCSAMSHKITLREPIDVCPVDFPIQGVEAYASSGTPADCVRFGMLNILKSKPDAVLSGINFGFNCGSDIQYSATVGAAMEAACSGIPAIAFSEGIDGTHEVTDAYLGKILSDLLERKLLFNQIWNVNFPQCNLEQFQGILEGRSVAHNAIYKDSYLQEALPGGGFRLTVSGELHEEAAEGTDFRAIVDGYISIGIVNNLK